LVVPAEGPAKIHCKVTMQGSSVFAGMQALLDAGYLKVDNLPGHVKEAPMLGGTIHVDNGHLVRKK
jgi:hypothetical protein